MILDNASFYKDGIIRKLLRKTGCGLWYFPPYSPDLNKIEYYWAKVKNFIVGKKKKWGIGYQESAIIS